MSSILSFDMCTKEEKCVVSLFKSRDCFDSVASNLHKNYFQKDKWPEMSQIKFYSSYAKAFLKTWIICN